MIHLILLLMEQGTSQFNLWNLNANTEEPFVSSTYVGSDEALNKLAWDKKDKKATIGSSDGRINVYDIGEVTLKHNVNHL